MPDLDEIVDDMAAERLDLPPRAVPPKIARVVPVDYKGDRIPASLLQLSDGSWHYAGLIPFTFKMRASV